MNKKEAKELENLGKAIKTIFSYKPKERYRSPTTTPSVTELNRRFRMDTPPKK